MIRQIRKIGSLTTLALALFLTDRHWDTVFAQDQSSPVLSAVESSSSFVTASAESPWRYTRYSWGDSCEWSAMVDIVRPPDRRFDSLHPMTWALLILLSVLASMLWASNEWEVAQLLGHEKLKDQPKKDPDACQTAAG